MEGHVLRKYHDELGHFDLEKTHNVVEKICWFSQIRSKIKNN